jgi:hypothetical protein
MSENNQPGDRSKINPASLVLGGILVLLGILFLIGQFFDLAFGFAIGEFAWPFFIIIPGIVLFIAAFLMEPRSGVGLAIAGSIVTMVGLILFVMNLTGLWASWAYAWALIFPTAVGLGQVIYGGLRRQGDIARTGVNMALIGFGIFVVAGFFFELVIGINGFNFGLGRLVWPVLLIGLGLIVLLLNFLPGRRSS